MKRLIGILLTAAMLTALLPTAAFAQGEAERTAYKSSENFAVTSEDGTWDGVWSATLINTANENPYSQITNVNDGGSFQDLTYYAYVNATEIAPVVNLEPAKNYYQTVGGAKTFTAPKSGNITISFADVTHAETTGAVVKHAWNQGVKFRITKQDAADSTVTKLYPTAGDFVVGQKDTALLMVASGTTATVTVNAGDKIHFEVMRDVADQPWQGVHCDPIITYTNGEGSSGAGGGGGTVTPAPTAKTIYKSSEDFAVTSADGKWGDVWTANMVDTNTDTYTAVTSVNNGCYWGNVKITDTQLVPYIGVTDNVTANNHIGAAKTFTAPKDGYVKISYAEVDNPNKRDDDADKKIGVSVFQINRQMGFRVRHESAGVITKIYPKSSEYLNSQTDWSTVIMVEADKVTNTLQVKQGDKIHFEVKKTVSGEDNWNGIYCDPIVEYVDEADVPADTSKTDPADKKVYTSSEAFNLEENGNYAWKWQYLDVNDKKYKDLTDAYAGTEGEDKDANNAPAWHLPANTQWNKQLGVSVGKYKMRVSIYEPKDTATDAEKEGELERNVAVKSFTAPKRGEVTISAAEFEVGHTSGGTALRILKHGADGTTTKLYPKEEEEAWVNIYPGDTFAPITTELEKGEILTFENALWKNNSPWQAIIYWDPVITYTKTVPVMDSTNTENGATDVPMNKEHVLTYSGNITAPSASDIKIYEISAEGQKTESTATVKSVTADGNDLKLVFDGLKPNTKYEITVGGVAFASTPDDKSSNTMTFTTGNVVNIGDASYSSGKVTVAINNSAATSATATLAVFLCKGTDSEYKIEGVRIVTRTDIGENDKLEAAISMPAGDDYFMKVLVLEDALSAVAYAPMTVLKGDN